MPTTGQQMETWMQLDANHWAHWHKGSWLIVNGIYVPADVLRRAASSPATLEVARAMLAALERMIADLREQEATHMCGRMRIQQIVDIEKATTAAKAAGIKAEG